jgi:hypothetical protein
MRLGIGFNGNLRLSLYTVNRLVYFLAVNRHIFWCDDSETHLVSTNFHHSNDDVVVNYNRLVFFPGQYEHWCLSFRKHDCDGFGIPARSSVSSGVDSATTPRAQPKISSPEPASCWTGWEVILYLRYSLRKLCAH